MTINIFLAEGHGQFIDRKRAHNLMICIAESVVEEHSLRDTPLPKLLSGELRLPAALRDIAAQAGVKDAERFITEATV